jgi:hypothetical protein
MLARLSAENTTRKLTNFHSDGEASGTFTVRSLETVISSPLVHVAIALFTITAPGNKEPRPEEAGAKCVQDCHVSGYVAAHRADAPLTVSHEHGQT